MIDSYCKLNEYFMFSREIQLIVIVLLYLATVITLNKNKGNLEVGLRNDTYYLEYLFAPIYEEIIFRGFIFGYLMLALNIFEGVIFSSLLFGLWHCKNIFLMKREKVQLQVVATGLFYGPLFALVTYITGNIWLAVILYYLNNLYFLLQLKKSPNSTNKS